MINVDLGKGVPWWGALAPNNSTINQIKSRKTCMFMFCKYKLFPLTEIKSKKKREKLFEIHDVMRGDLTMKDSCFKLIVLRNKSICRI